MLPGAAHTHEVVVVRPDDGRTLRWNTFPTREAADVERVHLARVGMYAIVRRLADVPVAERPE